MPFETALDANTVTNDPWPSATPFHDSIPDLLHSTSFDSYHPDSDHRSHRSHESDQDSEHGSDITIDSDMERAFQKGIQESENITFWANLWPIYLLVYLGIFFSTQWFYQIWQLNIPTDQETIYHLDYVIGKQKP